MEKPNNVQNERFSCLERIIIWETERDKRNIFRKIFLCSAKISRRKDYKTEWNNKVRNGPTPNYLDARVSQSQLLVFTLAPILSGSRMRSVDSNLLQEQLGLFVKEAKQSLKTKGNFSGHRHEWGVGGGSQSFSRKGQQCG